MARQRGGGVFELAGASMIGFIMWIVGSALLLTGLTRPSHGDSNILQQNTVMRDIGMIVMAVSALMLAIGYFRSF